MGRSDGRVISMRFVVKMTPPDAELDETDEATAVGYGLLHEMMLFLRSAGEREGFAVDIEISGTNLVY